jgi:hypothetical protein
MSSLALAVPIVPGKTEVWKRLIAEVTGPRRADTDGFHARLGVDKVNWYLQQTPLGDLFVLHMEGQDPAGAFVSWAQSEHPYDVWFKKQLEPLYGIDFNQPPPGPLPEMVYEYRKA